MTEHHRRLELEVDLTYEVSALDVEAIVGLCLDRSIDIGIGFEEMLHHGVGSAWLGSRAARWLQSLMKTDESVLAAPIQRFRGVERRFAGMPPWQMRNRNTEGLVSIEAAMTLDSETSRVYIHDFPVAAIDETDGRVELDATSDLVGALKVRLFSFALWSPFCCAIAIHRCGGSFNPQLLGVLSKHLGNEVAFSQVANVVESAIKAEECSKDPRRLLDTWRALIVFVGRRPTLADEQRKALLQLFDETFKEVSGERGSVAALRTQLMNVPVPSTTLWDHLRE